MKENVKNKDRGHLKNQLTFQALFDFDANIIFIYIKLKIE